MRNLDENARAVARFRVATAGAAVRQVDENLYALNDDVVRFLSLNMRNEPNSAGIMFVTGVVKTLGGRESTTDGSFWHSVYVETGPVPVVTGQGSRSKRS